VPKSDFLTLALAAHSRGLPVCPVDPSGKRGVFWGQFSHPATNVSEITQLSKDYPGHNVGVVGIRGVNNVMFYDNDAQGVVERIEADTGHKMPLTYAVQSSPQSAPWRVHYYFYQTAYSVSKWKANVNVKDLTKLTPAGKNATVYDLKGVGGGSFVVAEGSVRSNGEVYTGNGAAIIPIPDWLIDWFVSDIHRYNSEKMKALVAVKRRKAEARAAAKTPSALKKLLDPQKSGFEITREGTHSFLRSRSGSFAKLGVDRPEIEMLLAKMAVKFCEGGKSLALSQKGKEKFRKLAYDPKLKLGHAVYQTERHSPDPSGDVIVEPPLLPPGLHDFLVAALKMVPSNTRRMTSDAGYDRFEKALSGTGFTIDRNTTTGQRRAKKAREATGWEPKNVNGIWWWVRI
jgi:hypothetical protein